MKSEPQESKTANKSESVDDNSKPKESKRTRGRKNRAYPLGTLEDCHEFSKKIYEYGSGQKVRRLALFDKLEKSPDSSISRSLITNSSKYGLIKGSYASEFLELTTESLNYFGDEISDFEKHSILLKLSIKDIPVFNFIYERLNGNKLPNQAVICDIIKEEFKEIEPEDINSVVDLFIVNAQFLKILKLISGAERLVTFEYCLEEYNKETNKNSEAVQGVLKEKLIPGSAIAKISESETASLEHVCFYITPIGEEGTEQRQHSDLFLGSIVEPALETLDLKVVRADLIDKPGTITKQIIEYLSKAKLVIADLSFNNPNVFYELAIRHAFRLPTVQIVRKGDKIPFDVSSSRTIIIDTTNIYTLVPRIDTYRAEISNQVRQALKDPDNVDNPLTYVYPNIKLKI